MTGMNGIPIGNSISIFKRTLHNNIEIIYDNGEENSNLKDPKNKSVSKDLVCDYCNRVAEAFLSNCSWTDCLVSADH